MNKYFIPIFGLLAVAFLAVTVIKYYPGNEPLPSSTTGLDKENANQDSDVVDFWNYYDKATDLRGRGQYAEAIEFYRKALEIDSTHNNSLYYLGNMYLAMQNFEEADATWKKLSDSHSLSARGHLQLGNLYSCKNSGNLLYDLSAAKYEFQAAARLNAEETGPLLQLAKIRIIENNYEEAEKMLQDVTASNFRSTEAYFLAGYLHWKKGDIDRAGQQLEQAVLIHSEGGKKSQNVGEGETKEGDSPMLAASFRCSLFSEFIVKQIKLSTQEYNPTATVYQRLEEELSKY